MQGVPHQRPMLQRQVPLLGQQPNGQSPMDAAKMHVMQAIDQMAITIYLKIATDAIVSGEHDVAQLRKRAKDCHAAAKAYFEGLGVIDAGDSTAEA